MRTLALLVAALASTAAIGLDNKYKPAKQDPIYNSQTRAGAAEMERRKAEAAAKKDEPLVKVPVTKDSSIQTGTVGGNPALIIKKQTK